MYLGMTAGPRAAAAHRSTHGHMPVGGQNAATSPTRHFSPSPEHWALGTEHAGHRALGKVSAVSSTSRPLYSNFRTHFTVPRFSPALQTRQTRAVRTSVPQRSFRRPRTRDSPSREPCGALSCDRSRGWSPHSSPRVPVSQPCARSLRRGPPKSSGHAGARRLFLRLE